MHLQSSSCDADEANFFPISIGLKIADPPVVLYDIDYDMLHKDVLKFGL